jgi:hypothetical protein
MAQQQSGNDWLRKIADQNAKRLSGVPITVVQENFSHLRSSGKMESGSGTRVKPKSS